MRAMRAKDKFKGKALAKRRTDVIAAFLTNARQKDKADSRRAEEEEEEEEGGGAAAGRRGREAQGEAGHQPEAAEDDCKD